MKDEINHLKVFKVSQGELVNLVVSECRTNAVNHCFHLQLLSVSHTHISTLDIVQ